MNRYAGLTFAAAVVLVGMGSPRAHGQIIQSPQVNPGSLDVTESVRQGSLAARRPGRIIAAAAERHGAFQGLAFRGPHGTPTQQDAAQTPGFYVSILNDVLQAFFARLSLFMTGLNLLGGV